MALNPYFNGHKVKSEQTLVEKLIIESITIKGNNFKYCPRQLVSPDDILNEDPNSIFKRATEIEMYVPNSQDYSRDTYDLGIIGAVMEREIEFIVARKRFFQEFGEQYPKEGDLIYSDYNNTVWEIKFVDHEKSPIYQLQKMYIFSLIATPFVFSYETFDTGIDEVDFLNDVVDPVAGNDYFQDGVDDLFSFDPNDPFDEKIEE